MGRSTPRRALTAVEQLRLRYKPSPLTGPHALARRAVNKPEELKGALQLLKDNFLSQQTWQSAADQRRAAIAAQSSHGNLIVPNPRYSKLPVHVLANDKPQPWQLLPMRAAALKHYPDFFGQSSLFFSSLHGAVLKGAANQLLRPSKVWGLRGCAGVLFDTADTLKLMHTNLQLLTCKTNRVSFMHAFWPKSKAQYWASYTLHESKSWKLNSNVSCSKRETLSLALAGALRRNQVICKQSQDN
eukprot:1153691-Pelagomonas_calceolata.AAC.4